MYLNRGCVVMNEEELLDKLFDNELLWRGKYPVHWCDLCDTYSAGCPDCSGSSCNAMGCPKCCQDLIDFNREMSPRPMAHLNEADRAAVERYHSVKRHIRRCLREGKRFIMAETPRDEFSENEIELFKNYLDKTTQPK